MLAIPCELKQISLSPSPFFLPPRSPSPKEPPGGEKKHGKYREEMYPHMQSSFQLRLPLLLDRPSLSC